MKDSLARSLLQAHAAGGDIDAAGPWGRVRLRPDHVVLGESAAHLALAALDGAGPGRIAVEIGLVCADRRPLHTGFEQADVLTRLQERVLARGFHFAPPGSGQAGEVYAERFAAPGRLVLCAGTAAWRAAAFGTLALEVDVLEAAAALLSGAVDVWIEDARLLSLRGRRVAGVAGEDVALALRARLAPGEVAGRVLEFGGEGLAELDMTERWRLASVASRLGARAALLPSDERTRDQMRAIGRESDWRALRAGEEPESPGDVLDLDVLEPLLAPRALPRAPRRVLDMAGASVAAVRLGSEATEDDLERFREVFGGASPRTDVRVSWEPASRAAIDRAEHSGLLAALTAIGVELRTEAGLGPVPAGSGLTLVFGAGPEPRHERDEETYDASLETCAIGALTGNLRDPRERFASQPAAAARPSVALTSSRVLVPPRAEAVAGEPAVARLPGSEALTRPLRGSVLLRRDRLPVAEVLAWGARRFPEEGDVTAFARHLFTDLDPEFAVRVAAHGGGFVVAGEGFGAGAGEGERAALALAVAGVRATLARSYDPDWRARLVRAGVLPLRLGLLADFESLAPGDEIELPGLPHALAEGRSLAVRNLTRGTQLLAHHDLDAHDLAIVGAGGLLPATVQAA